MAAIFVFFCLNFTLSFKYSFEFTFESEAKRPLYNPNKRILRREPFWNEVYWSVNCIKDGAY